MNISRTNGNRSALITGASKGLGFALADFLAAQGVNLIITARRAERLETAKRQLQRHGVTVLTSIGDVSDSLHRQNLVDLVKQLGGLDFLVNNASSLGPLPLSTLAEYPLDQLRRVFEINAIAPLALVQLLEPFLKKSRGLVINLSSDAAIGGYETWGGYGSGKAALDLISLTLANELNEEGIGVVSVDPGDMRTDMQQDAFPGQDISDRPLPQETLPFWAWLFNQNPANISGQRFQAQSELWEVAV
jgi:NAD(P)-dependent dehydrogenase (short-subunit alcohol dehydrogenase family)